MYCVTNNNQSISYKLEIKQCVTNFTNLTINKSANLATRYKLDYSSTVISFLGAYSNVSICFLLSMRFCLEIKKKKWKKNGKRHSNKFMVIVSHVVTPPLLAI